MSGRYIHTRVGDRLFQQHVLIAERVLGRPLPPKAVVHHHDENKSNNANSNLVICDSQSYHRILHERMRLLQRGINPDTHWPCSRCRQVFTLDHFYRRINGRPFSACKQCCSRYGERRKASVYWVVRRCLGCGAKRRVGKWSPVRDLCISCGQLRRRNKLFI